MICSQIDAAIKFGLIVDYIQQDEELHRVPTVSKPKAKNGWYIAYNEILIMGDWQTGLTETFKQGSDVVFSKYDRLKIKQRKERRIREKVTLQEKVASFAETRYDNANQAAIHPYLSDKGIDCAIGLKAYDNYLLVPLINLASGRVENLQRIFPDGKKRFLKNGRVSGLCCPYGFNGISLGKIKEIPKLLVCEGYATAASLYQMTKIPVLAAMNANNLLPVVKTAKEKWPDVEIIVAGDDDFLTEQETGINQGRLKATEAANEVEGTVSFPPFTVGDKHAGLTDWNDYFNAIRKEAIL